MLEFVDILLIQKRRLIFVGVMITIDILLISLLAPTVQAHRASFEARIHTPYASQMSQDESPNAVTNGLSNIANGVGRVSNDVEIGLLKGTISLAVGIIAFNRAIEHGAYTIAAVTVHGVGDTVGFVADAIGGGFHFVGAVIGGSYHFTGHVVGGTVSFVSGLAHVGSFIRPTDRTPAPTITQLRAQQAALIQSGTKDVFVASATEGFGGACDDGNGNGGYPMAWCNAPMDTVATVSYTSDRINRECTSYVYWYFTSVEGHADFRAHGDARDWADTSSYPTHAMPAVGAIAVETAGAYGHVAIVQGLPGQKFAGQTVPAGYVLVSEMNYDWNGHFRYSYSPLSKFSAYIYP